MNDHASKQFLIKKLSKQEQLKASEDHAKRIVAKKKSITGRFGAFCEAVCKLPPLAMVKRYRGYRSDRNGKPKLTRRAAFWLAFNHYQDSAMSRMNEQSQQQEERENLSGSDDYEALVNEQATKEQKENDD